jgi:hypothetical protein
MSISLLMTSMSGATMRSLRPCAGLVNLLKDLAVPETFLVAVDDLVIPNADAGVTVLEEPVGVVP